MSCVLPAWNIIEVLNLPDLVDHRERQDTTEEERRGREGAPQSQRMPKEENGHTC
jgi:hypothetical protein